MGARVLARSSRISDNNINNNRSQLIKALEHGLNELESYEDVPGGMFGTRAIIRSKGIVIDSNELDIDFTVPFDDDTEANQADIVIYNLSQSTINRLKPNNEISIEAGYKNDTGVIFKGFIDSVRVKYTDVDKETHITCYDSAKTKATVVESFSENTKASTILRALIAKLNAPIAVFSVRRDWIFQDSVVIDGELAEEIKKYADICGISVYACNGSIYARYIKDGDNLNFTINDSTGLIGSPEHYTEEINTQGWRDVIDGYKIESLLQHRINTASIVNVSSREVNGAFRVRRGEHSFISGEALTRFEAIGSISSFKEEKEESSTNVKTATQRGLAVIEAGKKFIGTPYKYGGKSIKGMDCSYFVVRAFKESKVKSKLTGYNTSQGIYNMSTKINKSDRRVGDIIFFKNPDANHIGIYSGGEKMLHCYSGGGVKETPISYGGNLVGYGRLT